MTVCWALQFGSPEALKLREEANKYFGRKEYVKALEAYERALKVTPEEGSTEDRALLHSNKAACFMMQQKCAPTLTWFKPDSKASCQPLISFYRFVCLILGVGLSGVLPGWLGAQLYMICHPTLQSSTPASSLLCSCNVFYAGSKMQSTNAHKHWIPTHHTTEPLCAVPRRMSRWATSSRR